MRARRRGASGHLGRQRAVDPPAHRVKAMSTSLHDHRVNVADLVDQPGASRRVDLSVPIPEGFDFPLMGVGSPLRLEAVLESVVDGLLVRGSLTAQLDLRCARCLRPLQRDVEVDVVELFVDPARATADALADLEPGYQVADDHIDLDALLRDELAPSAPHQPLCDDGCRGLCAQCGADLNTTACGCGDDDVDPRWAELAQLRDRLPADD